MKRSLPIIIFLGLIIRILLIGNPGFEADVAFWKSWSLAASEHGIIWMVQNTNNNYPPGFGYVLWVIGNIYRLFGNPHYFQEYWNAGNFWFLFTIKLIPIASDVAIASGIYWLLSRPKLLGLNALEKTNFFLLKIRNLKLKISIPLASAALYYLHPVPILDGAWWGQVDALGVLFLLLTLILLFTDHPSIAVFTITVGFLLKLQNIVYLPILFLFILRRFNLNALKRSIFSAFLAWIIVTLPFILSKKVDISLYLIGANADWFPWLSLHAYNIWWILSGGNGMGFSDKFLLWGALSPKVIGLILFSGAYLISTLVTFLKPNPKALIASLFLAVFSFFMLLTQSHERYIFPAFLILPLLLPYITRVSREQKKPFIKLFFIFFVILSATATFDLHRTLIINYPNNGLPILSLFKSINLTIIASYINIILYLASLVATTLIASAWILPVGIGFVLFGLIFANSDYLYKGKVSLTKLKMTGWYQAYASPQTDLAVSSYSGPNSWNRLSTMYFFYRKGIGSHAKSELLYELRGKFSRFSSDYGVDTEANTAASVKFQVIGDGKILFTSEKMGRFDFPRHTDVDIRGVNKFKLVILPTDDGNRDDHADWLNPMFYK